MYTETYRHTRKIKAYKRLLVCYRYVQKKKQLGISFELCLTKVFRAGTEKGKAGIYRPSPPLPRLQFLNQKTFFVKKKLLAYWPL